MSTTSGRDGAETRSVDDDHCEDVPTAKYDRPAELRSPPRRGHVIRRGISALRDHVSGFLIFDARPEPEPDAFDGELPPTLRRPR